MEERIIDLARFDATGQDLRHLPLAVVDVETTGGISGPDRVVEIAIVSVSPAGKITDEWSTLVNPEREVDWNGQRVHGISTNDLRDAPTFRQVAGDVLERLDGALLVAHNISAEDRFLATEFDLLGKRNLKIPALCTWRLAKRVLPLPSHKLGVCCEFLDISLDDAHAALADAYATAQLAPLLLKWETEGLSWSSPPRRVPSLKPSGTVHARPVAITRAKTPLTRPCPQPPATKPARSSPTRSRNAKSRTTSGATTANRVWCEPGVPDAALASLEANGYTIAKYFTASVVAAVCADAATDDPKVAQARDRGIAVVHWSDLSSLGVTPAAPPKPKSTIPKPIAAPPGQQRTTTKATAGPPKTAPSTNKQKSVAKQPKLAPGQPKPSPRHQRPTDVRLPTEQVAAAYHMTPRLFADLGQELGLSRVEAAGTVNQTEASAIARVAEQRKLIQPEWQQTEIWGPPTIPSPAIRPTDPRDQPRPAVHPPSPTTATYPSAPTRLTPPPPAPPPKPASAPTPPARLTPPPPAPPPKRLFGSERGAVAG